MRTALQHNYGTVANLTPLMSDFPYLLRYDGGICVRSRNDRHSE